MFHGDDKNVKLRENSMEKSAGKFCEPDDMVSVELNSVPEHADKAGEPQKFDLATVKKRMIKLFIYIAFVILTTLSIITVIGKFEKVSDVVPTTEIIPQAIVTESVKYHNLEKCLQTRNFVDCCMYESNNEKYPISADCTVENVLKIFDDFQDYYLEMKDDLNNMELFVGSELDINFERKRRQVPVENARNYEYASVNNDRALQQSNAYGNFKLDETEIADTQNLHEDNLYTNKHYTVNTGNSDEDIEKYGNPMTVYENSNNSLNEDDTLIPYFINQNNLEYDYLDLSAGSYSNEDTDDNDDDTVNNDLIEPESYNHNNPIDEHYELNAHHDHNPQAVPTGATDTLNPPNNPIASITNSFSPPSINQQEAGQFDHKNQQQIYAPNVINETVAPNYNPINAPATAPQPSPPSPPPAPPSPLASAVYAPASSQNAEYFAAYVGNDDQISASNTNSNFPPIQSNGGPPSAVSQAAYNNPPLETPNLYQQQMQDTSASKDYILKAIQTQSKTEETVTGFALTTTLKPPPSKLDDLRAGNSPRESFSSNADASPKINMNNVNGRDFQIAKPKVNQQFQGANIDLQTSQHSAVNSNFNGRQCQLVGSTYPYAQQLPFNYDASQGTQFAQLLPVNMPKANPYVVPSYNVIQPNYVYQPINNNPMYPFAYNPYYNGLMPGMTAAATSSSLQAITSNGQYYVCNPIAPPSNNIINMPGVEIRDNSMQNLQDIIDGSVTFEEVNNKTRASDRCPFDEHMCADNVKCIKRGQICDGHVNCNDASDEAYCSCKYRVGSARLCDGYFDCPNGEDELGCFGCGMDSFSCDDWTEDEKLSTCVPLEQRCDGVPQCPTGKDEEDCSILTNRIVVRQIYKISNSIGFLHRNYKGKWYPACSNPETWAADACNSESGPSAMAPLTHMVPVDVKYEGSYINSLANGAAELAATCVPGRAVYVQCPEPTCGIRKLFKNPYRSDEVDTSVENFLSNNNLNRRSSGNFSDSILRVVGGRPSQPAAWPWIVSVYRNGIFHCGGTILNPSWIITAAHCVDKYWQYYYEVEAGILRRFSYSPMEQNRFVSHVIPHKDYDRANLKNDLAIMRLSAPLRYNRYVRPICLPNKFTAGPHYYQEPSPGTICTAVGWGATIEHGADPDHLREVDVPILSHCKHIEDEIGNEICAGLSDGGRDACQGDSGGPFLCRNPMAMNQWYLAGIVSHGEGCARPHEPGVYTRVSKYIDWIFRHANELALPKLVPLSHCPGYTCRLINRCLPKRRRCDKIVDCLVGDDEMDCDNVSFRNLFKNTVRQMYLGSVRNVSDANNFNNANATNATGDEENSTPFEALLLQASSDKGERTSNADVTTEIYRRVDAAREELISTTESATAITEFVYGEVVSHLNNVTDKIDATFLCKSMLEVVPLTKRCNKIADCQDGTDEENCKCLDYLKNIQPDALCDGTADCYDLSDENLCSNCKSDEFKCHKRNRCVHNAKVCDGVPDCPSEEDEWDCVILTNGITVELDKEARPVLNTKGIITINDSGSWKRVCANWSAIEASTATDVCLSLGFVDYKSFQRLSINGRSNLIPLSAAFNGKADDDRDHNKCDALYVTCSNVTVDLARYEAGEANFTRDNLHNSPWNAAVYVDGKYECIGIILKFNWILTSAACFSLRKSIYITVLLGTTKPYLSVGGPHDQVIRVADVVPVPKVDMFMLRLEREINITRYVRPALFRWKKYVARMTETCFAMDKKLNLLPLKPLSDDNCDDGHRCFVRISPNNCTDNKNTTGYVMCNDGNGWYPAAFYHNKSLNCDFNRNESLASISYNKNNIFHAIDQGFYGIHTSLCTGFRCLRGNCIRSERICDGIPQCSYGEDEEFELCTDFQQRCNLTESCPCLPSELQCLNGKCVNKSTYCDDINDCGDWSDEPTVCDCSNYLRLSNASKICDGDVNCYDKSDEDPAVCGCKENSYSCKNSSLCVTNALLCDGIKQCPGGDDEDFCYSLVSNGKDNHYRELYIRTAGLWHTGCFAKNTTMEELNSICVNLGFEKIYSSYNRRPEVEVGFRTKRPVIDTFNMVHINSRLKFPMRTGNDPYLRFVEDENCNALFIQCT